MLDREQAVYQYLKEKGVSYEVVSHEPVYTIEDMVQLKLPHLEAIAKNLFVRDDKKRNYYLFVVSKDKRVELKKIRHQIDARPLTFASEEDLKEFLNLTKGAVTPFGLLNDKDRRVTAIFDKDFEHNLIGIHPNVNTATVWLQTQDLIHLIEEHGNIIKFIEL